MSSIFSIFCGTTFSSIFHFFKEQYQCLQELTKHYSNATVEEKFKIIAEQERQYHQIVNKVLSDFLGRQTSKDQLKVLTFILFGTCNGIYYWYDPKGSMTPEELSKIISNILCKGLLGFEAKRKVKMRGQDH